MTPLAVKKTVLTKLQKQFKKVQTSVEQMITDVGGIGPGDTVQCTQAMPVIEEKLTNVNSLALKLQNAVNECVHEAKDVPMTEEVEQLFNAYIEKGGEAIAEAIVLGVELESVKARLTHILSSCEHHNEHNQSNQIDPDREPVEDEYFDPEEVEGEQIDPEQLQDEVDDHMSTSGSEKLAVIEQLFSKLDERQRLPKIPTPSFNGDTWEWDNFWTIFEANIHLKGISNLEKFHHLLAALTGPAKDCVKRYRLTADNYEKALAKLRSKFSNDEVIVDQLLALLDKAKAESPKATDQRVLLDQVTTLVEQLTDRKENLDGIHMTKSVLMKFSGKFQRDVLKKHSKEKKGSSWKMDWLLETLEDLITPEEEVERALQLLHPEKKPVKGKEDGKNPDPKSNKSLGSKGDRKKCKFCHDNHSSWNCPSYSTPEAREQFFKKEGLCLNCSGKGHYASDCRNTRTCKCGGKHHGLICRKQGLQQGNTSTAQSNSGKNTGTSQKPVTEAGHKQPTSGKPTVGKKGTTTAISSEPVAPQYPSEEVRDALQLRGDNSRSRTGQAIVLVGSAKVFSPKSMKLEKVPVLLDSGSNVSFILEEYANEIGVPTVREKPLLINSFGNTSAHSAREIVQVTIFDENDEGHRFELYKKDVMTASLAQPVLSDEDWKFVSDRQIKLSRQPDGSPVQPKILIGMDQMYKIQSTEYTLPTGLQLTATRLGYVIGGAQYRHPDKPDEVQENRDLTVLSVISQLDSDEAEFHQELQDRACQADSEWAFNSHLLDEFNGTEAEEKLRTNKTVLAEFEQTIERREDGYYVRLPWKEQHPELPDNKSIAFRRLQSVKNLLEKEPPILEQYHQTFMDQLQKGILEEVSVEEPPGRRIHFLPHQPVITPHKDTTKLRVVFDASAHYKEKPSLNQVVHQGPTILPDITDMLIRFRLNRHVVLSDVEKAFLQVRLHEDDRDACRCFWLKDPKQPVTNENLKVYRFTRVTFGVNASPFLLAATIFHHLNATEVLSEKLKGEVRENLYVDNLILTTNSVMEAVDGYHSSKEFFNELNMNLREFMSNSQDVLSHIEEKDKATNQYPKVLGIQWDAPGDTVRMSVDIPWYEKLTKRVMAKQLHSVYDPLGWMIPLLLPGKQIMQAVWKQELNWDDPIPPEYEEKWNQFLNESRYHLQTHRMIAQAGVDYKLIAFCDASKDAMACCVYLVGHNSWELVKAKSKVQPISTIPKMELQAMLMACQEGARVFDAVRNTLTITGFYVFSDSKISLGWVGSHPDKKETGVLVANRIRSIRQNVHELAKKGLNTKFGYVYTEENPADCATRGLDTEQFHGHFWWHGPDFIRNPEDEWPEENTAKPLPADTAGEEEDSTVNVISQEVTAADSELVNFDRISTTDRKSLPFGYLSANRVLQAKRRTVYVLRFVKKLCEKSSTPKLKEIAVQLEHMNSNGLSQSMGKFELRVATEKLFICHQKKNFPEHQVQRMSDLNVRPTATGLLKCFGRLGKAGPDTPKCPILLAGKTPLTQAAILDAHEACGHGGTAQTMATVRRDFWVPKLRQQVAMIVRKCITCQKENNLPYKYPKMGDLPTARVTRTVPFSNIGLDYFGPLKIRKENGEGGTAFGCILTCMTTRMVHLELVPDGTTASFLNALRRFFARRGVPEFILCDNAPTFLLGEDILREAVERWKHDPDVEAAICSKAIEWKHITAYAPWQGGMYERLIKNVKSALYKILKNRTVSFDTLGTVLTEVESIVNCRPLTYQEERWEDHPILRPIDFLQRDMLFSIPRVQSEEEEVDQNYFPPVEAAALRTRQQAVEAVQSSMDLTEKFWEVWQTQYLTSLREKHRLEINKKKGTPKIPKKGAVVLIVDQLQPRHSWKLARIQEVVISPDGSVREVQLKTTQGRRIARPVNLIVPLELDGTEYVSDDIEGAANEQVAPAQQAPREPQKRYNLRNRPRVDYDERDTAEVLPVTGERPQSRGWLRSWSLPNLSTLLICITLASLGTPTEGHNPATVNFGNVTGSLQCTSEGVQADTTNVKSMQVCADWFCKNWDDPRPMERVRLPAEVILHDHAVQWKVSDGEQVTATQMICRASSFCQAVDCTFCTATIFNPECNPTLAILAVGVIFYILIMGIYGCLYVPVVVGRPWILMGNAILGGTKFFFRAIFGCFKYFRKLCRKKRPEADIAERREHRQQLLLKELFMAVLLISMLSTAQAQCLDVDVFSHVNTKCVETDKGMSCSVQTSEVLKMSPYQNEACLRLVKNGTLIKQMHIRLSEVILSCDEETLTYTREVQTQVISSKRCPRTGSCTEGKCVDVNDTAIIPELQKGNEYPGRTGCTESCGGPGCDCFFLGSGCLFYRIFAFPVEPTIYRLFRCQRWKESVKIEISEEKKKEFNLLPMIPVTHGGITATLSSITVPPLSILNARFITDEEGTAVWRSDKRPNLRCISAEDARNMSCAFIDDCECHSAEIIMNCRCRDNTIGKDFVDLRNHLPLVTPGVTVRSKEGILQTKVENLVTAEIVLQLHDKVNVETEIREDHCEIAEVSVSGCYRCSKGATVTATCTSKTGRTTAQVDCKTTAFQIPCSSKGVTSKTQVAAEKAQLNLECVATCGHHQTNFAVAGILKFTANFEESARKWLNGEITSFWEIQFPDWAHVFEVYQTWYKTVLLTVLGVGMAVLVTYLYIMTCGWRTLTTIITWSAKLMGKWLDCHCSFFVAPGKRNQLKSCSNRGETTHNTRDISRVDQFLYFVYLQLYNSYLSLNFHRLLVLSLSLHNCTSPMHRPIKCITGCIDRTPQWHLLRLRSGILYDLSSENPLPFIPTALPLLPYATIHSDPVTFQMSDPLDAIQKSMDKLGRIPKKRTATGPRTPEPEVERSAHDNGEKKHYLEHELLESDDNEKHENLETASNLSNDVSDHEDEQFHRAYHSKETLDVQTEKSSEVKRLNTSPTKSDATGKTKHARVEAPLQSKETKEGKPKEDKKTLGKRVNAPPSQGKPSAKRPRTDSATDEIARELASIKSILLNHVERSNETSILLQDEIKKVQQKVADNRGKLNAILAREAPPAKGPQPNGETALEDLVIIDKYLWKHLKKRRFENDPKTKVPCVFCDQKTHDDDCCAVLDTAEKRIEKLRESNRCLGCFQLQQECNRFGCSGIECAYCVQAFTANVLLFDPDHHHHAVCRVPELREQVMSQPEVVHSVGTSGMYASSRGRGQPRGRGAPGHRGAQGHRGVSRAHQGSSFKQF